MATAYAALVSLLNTLDHIQNHPLHSFSFENKQIESLLEIVNFLINFMETDHNGDRSGRAHTLEKRIASAAHAAGYLIDFHVADQIRNGSTRRGKTKVSRFLLDLQKAIDDMEFVRRKAIKFHKAIKAQPTFSSSSSAAAATSSPSTSLTSQKNTMVGFDDVLLKLFDLLIGEAAGRRVIPIVGMGGIGKTTLAKHAFQHMLIVENFDVRLWVTISQKYDVEIILNELLSGSGRLTGGSVAELGVRLYRSLFGRRYLIILDDMWSCEVWYEIMSYFPDDKHNRSRIVVTTRQSDMANHLTSLPCFPLDLLPMDKSWDLFCETIFGDKNGCPPELKVAGYRIVEKCRGLPLAIIVVAGHLWNSSRRNAYWEYVAKDMDSVLSSGEKSCLDILSLSYSYLPVHLKPCFLYMASFEEDKTVETAILIKLWIGEGFLKQSESHNLEEVAEGYLKDLVDRNLILASKRKLNGNIEGCEIHDVVRELCLNIVDKEKFLCVLDNSQARHWERRGVSKSIRGDLLKSSPFICSERVLNNVDEDLLEFGCDRLNLRYLGCLMPEERTPLYISPSISLLWSLQTLIVTSLSDEIIPFVAPYEFWEMLQLRHVEIDNFFLPDPVPSDCDGLDQTNLQTLTHATNFRLSEEVCKRISHIRKLRISYLVNDASEFDDATSLYCLHNISRLHQLESLHCSFFGELMYSGFPQSLTFPNSLKELSLTMSRLYWEELSNMAGLLPLLEVLDLGLLSVMGSEWETIEGHFERLKSLRINRCLTLVNFNIDSSHFPGLTDLTLSHMENLHELPPSIGELPSLHRIELSGCSVSLAMSAIRILVEQEQEYGNEGIKLEVDFGLFLDDRRMIFLKQMEEEALSSNNLLLQKWHRFMTEDLHGVKADDHGYHEAADNIF